MKFDSNKTEFTNVVNISSECTTRTYCATRNISCRNKRYRKTIRCEKGIVK